MKTCLYLIVILFITNNLFAQTQQYKIDREFFIENKGQWNSEVLYLAKLNGMNAWITKTGVVYDFYKIERNPLLISPGGGETVESEHVPFSPLGEIKSGSSVSPPPGEIKRGLRFDSSIIKGHVIKSSYNNINPNPEHIGIKKSEAYYNYFIGKDSSKWVSFVPLYAEVIIKSIYNGIDIRYYFDKGKLRYDYNIQPGADISQIKMKFDGQDGLSINNTGDLVINTSPGEVIQGKLYAFQTITHPKTDSHRMSSESNRKQIQCKYKINPDGSICFFIEKYNPDLSLVIDPIVWATYLGGSEAETYLVYTGSLLDIDRNDNPVITGMTRSVDFPTSSGSYQISNAGYQDIIITKLNSNGSSIVFSTYYGGSYLDISSGIKIDGNNNIFISGWTNSPNFPVTNGAYQTMFKNSDCFVTKLNSTGSALIYSTYFGGSDLDICMALNVDNNGNAIISGVTYSSDFPVSENVYRNIMQGDSMDIFLTKLNSTGSAVIFSTFFGGSGSKEYEDESTNILLSSSGEIIIVGTTNDAEFPITNNAYQSNKKGYDDIFISVFNSDGSSLIYSTYIGGSDKDWYCRASMDNSNNVYVTGLTYSSDFPTTSDAYSKNLNGLMDIFVFKFNPFSNNLYYSTYIGGSAQDDGVGIKVNASGEAYIVGGTISYDFPITACAPKKKKFNGDSDIILCKLNSTGSTLIYSVQIGGNCDGGGRDIVLCSDGKCLISGITYDSYLNDDFPATQNAFDTSYNGGWDDFFLLKYDMFTSPPSISSVRNINLKQLICENQRDTTFWVKNTGDCELIISNATFSGSNISDFSRLLPVAFPDTVYGHDSIQISLRFAPANPGIKTADFSIANNSSVNPWVLSLSGRKDSISYVLSGLLNDTLSFGKVCKNSFINDTLFNIQNTSTIATTLYKGSIDKPFSFTGEDMFFSQFGLNETRQVKFRVTSTLDTGIFVQPFTIIDTCGRKKTIYLKLEVFPLPHPFVSGENSVCANNTYNYKASPIDGFSNHWKIEGGKIESFDNNQINITWDSAGIASLTLIQTNIETNCTDSIRKIIFINPLPSMKISGSLNACKNSEYTYFCKTEKNVSTEWFISGGTPENSKGDTINIAWSDSDKGTIKLIRKNITTGCKDSANFTITLNSLPFPLITGPTIVCGKGKYTYTSNYGGIINCDWHIVGGTPTIASGNKVDVNWGDPGTGKITLIQTNTETGCKDSVKIEITIGDKIKPTIAGRYTFCVGGSTVLKADADYDEYKWSTGETTKEITVKTAGKYSLYVKNNDGCEGTSDEINVRETQPPKPEIEAINNLCEGNPAILHTKDKFSSYQWSTGETNPEITVTNAGKITVSVIDSNGCRGSSDEYDLRFNPKPKTNITGSTTVCIGSTANYSIENQTDCDIKWTVSNGDLKTSDNLAKIDVNWTQLGSGKVKLFITNNVTGCSDSSEIEITIGTELKPVIIGPRTICSGTTILLSADADYDFYDWSNGENTKSIEINKGGEYWLNVKNNGGCSGSSETITVTQNPNPEPQITGIESLCKGESGKLKVDKVYKVIKWNTGETTEKITVTGPGNYSVEVTDDNGCSGKTEFVVKERKADLSGIINVNLGNVSMGKSKQQTITIKNIGIETIKIKSITLQTAQEYSLSTVPSPLTELLSNDEAKLNITFLSNQTGIYIDNITIETEQPCKDKFRINLTAECTGHSGKVTIWLPDTSAYAGEKDYCIPFRANYTGEESPLDIGYTAEIRFSSKAMDIATPTETIENGENVVNFSGNVSLNKGINKLGEFCGMVLLSDQSLNPLQISKFEWSEALATDTTHGSLKILACQETLPAVKFFTPASIEITPNPSNETADITISGEGNSTLEIYSVQGQLVLKQNMNIGNSKVINLNLNLKDFGAGVYYAVVKSIIGIASTRMDVVK